MKNYTQNMVEKLVPDPFIKIRIELISGPIVWNVIKFVFIVCSSRKSTKIYLNESAKHLLLSYIKLLFFFKKKKDLELVFLPRFLHDFRRKIFLKLYFIDWRNFIAWFPLLFAICCPTCDVINFEINLSFLIKTKMAISQKLKTAFIMK